MRVLQLFLHPARGYERSHGVISNVGSPTWITFDVHVGGYGVHNVVNVVVGDEEVILPEDARQCLLDFFQEVPPPLPVDSPVEFSEGRWGCYVEQRRESNSAPLTDRLLAKAGERERLPAEGALPPWDGGDNGDGLLWWVSSMFEDRPEDSWRTEVQELFAELEAREKSYWDLLWDEQWNVVRDRQIELAVTDDPCWTGWTTRDLKSIIDSALADLRDIDEYYVAEANSVPCPDWDEVDEWNRRVGLWQKHYGRRPRAPEAIWQTPPELLGHFRLKWFLQLLRELQEHKSRWWIAAVLATHLAGNWRQYRDKLAEYAKVLRRRGAQVDMEFNRFMRRYMSTHGELVKFAADGWEGLPHTLSGVRQEYIMQCRYEGVKDISVAMACAEVKLSQKKFLKYQRFWLDRTARDAWRIPDVLIQEGDYLLERLGENDPRQVLAGEFTNCCQHLYDNGRECAIHSATSPYGGVYVLRRKGKIIAQSWAWIAEDKETLVLDSIEVLKGHRDNPQVRDMFLHLAQEIVATSPISEVRQGAKTGIFLPGEETSHTVQPYDYPWDGWSDARKRQIILAATEE